MRPLSILLALILTAYAALGTFMRYEADDYCQAADAIEYGVIGEPIHAWLTWNGRYAQNTVSPALYLALGERGSQIVPALMLAALVGTGYLVTRRWLIALAFTYAVIGGLQNLWQVLMWQAGASTYLAPIVCCGALVYALSRFAPLVSMRVLR